MSTNTGSAPRYRTALAVAMNVYLAQLFGIGVGVVINYLLNDVWTFEEGTG